MNQDIQLSENYRKSKEDERSNAEVFLTNQNEDAFIDSARNNNSINKGAGHTDKNSAMMSSAMGGNQGTMKSN